MWKKPWFRELSPAEKAAWFYIKDECDNVGVWCPDFKLAEFQIGESIDWDSLPSKTNGNIEVLENGKWFLVDFVEFQYGGLKDDPKNKPHQSYLKLLQSHGLLHRVSIDYGKGINTHKDKDKDKDRKKTGKYSENFELFWNAYPRKDGSKSKAYEYWKRDGLETDLDVILSKLEAFKRSKQWTKDGGDFIPHATTWLNQRRYESEPTNGGVKSESDFLPRFK